MARHLRIPSATDTYHVMNRGAARQPVFPHDRDRLDFGRELRWMHDELGVDVLAYCLMGNHYHLVLRAPPGTLSPAMKHLGQGITQRLNARTGRDGAVYRGRFHSIPVETDGYLVAATRYVHRNPLDIAGVADLADYRWSSYGAYRGRRAAPVFLDPGPLMSLLDGSGAALVELTEGADDGPAHRSAWPGLTTAADVRQVVACGRAVDEMAHPDEGLGPGADRVLMALVADRCEDPVLEASILDDLDHVSPDARQRSMRRARHRLAGDATLRRVLTWVEATLAAGTDQEGSDPSRPPDQEGSDPFRPGDVGLGWGGSAGRVAG